MKRSTWLGGMLATCIMVPSAGALADAGKVTVFAAASLREAFEAAGPAFTAKTGIAVNFNFGGSDTLATQITQGAPADVFASANQTQMKKLVDAGLISGSPVTFARNRLVVIVPKANPAKLERFADLQRPGIKLVVADPTVPVGKYARAAFAAMNGKDGVPADFDATVEKNIVSNELDVKAVATKITLGEGDAGVVYATDVTPKVAAAVTLIDVPPVANPDATYPIGVLSSAPNPSGAQAFVQFITTDGQPFLKARGFH